jgi:hypothetical protein
MPRFYGKYLTRTLSEALEESTSISPAEQLQLYDELALIRDAAGQAVQMYALAREALEQNKDAAKTSALQQIVMQASLLMRDHLSEVVKVCESAARIEQQAKDKISIHQLHFFINQIVRCAYDAFDGSIEHAQTFENYVRNHIRLPASGENGTALTPDMDVQAMDDTVPHE